MKFLADENIASSVVKALRKAGYDVKDIKEEKMQRAKDTAILTMALQENRIILTHDKDFGFLHSSSQREHRGIILLRLYKQKPQNVLAILLNILRSKLQDQLQNNLTVLSESHATVHRRRQ